MFSSALMWFFLNTIGYTRGYENIALNKPTYLSHRYYSLTHAAATFDSSNAVDGLKTDLSDFGGQCVTSAAGQKSATWWVNLTTIYSIHDIRIYYKTDNAKWDSQNGYTARFLGFYLYISNTTDKLDGLLCFHDTKFNRSTIPAVVNITCPVHGQYIIYYNERPQESPNAAQFSSGAHAELCEVEVYGCNNIGYFGPTCLFPCPDTNCRYCHIETGACQGCKPGYQGHRCELPCRNHFYGEVCKEKCGNCSDGMTCHHVNGKCTNGCDVGVYGAKCKATCPVGWYGKNCSDKCNNCDSCDRITGQCTSQCHAGWKGKTCREACDGGMYGQNCTLACGACLYNRQCHHVNGSCPEGCDIGYKGELCQTACSSGTYGYNCKEYCNVNCGETKHCNGTTGECVSGCQTGWKGQKCNEECDGGLYGQNCTKRCGACLHYRRCHHVNGSCLEGCDTGFKGELCQAVCDTGYFGYDCEDECSKFCKISRHCNHMTGFCKGGCKTGWQGKDCFQVQILKEKECESRFYGVLITLCFCVLLIAVIVAVLCLKSRKHKAIKMKEDDTEMYHQAQSIHSNKGTAENIPGDYQELGSVEQPSTYEAINHKPR